MVKRPVTVLTIKLYPDTRDEVEAVEDANDFITVCKEGWYSSIRVVSGPQVEWEDEEK